MILSNEKLEAFFEKLIKNPLTRAYLLAVGRHAVTVVGTALASYGWVTNSQVSDFLGFLTVVVGIYLSQMDVKSVDQKIKQAGES